MKISKSLSVAGRKEWRAWLAKNHAKENEVWLIYHKKRSGNSGIAYVESVEEALCFGWIDSIIQKIDEDAYVRKFTPRKSSSHWSALNKQRVAGLIKDGKMTKAGLSVINYESPEDDYGRTSERARQDPIPPPFLEQALKKNIKAWKYFQSLAPSYRRNYIGWISAAKTGETRNKRVRKAVALLAENKKLGMK
jgi:uncharacterized protein YdeI (YjbR/CyaY-like superfamily)